VTECSSSTRVSPSPGGFHHVNDGVEYVVRTDPHDGGMGEVLNIWTSSGSSSFLTALGGAR
jgi:hypothetical protein